MYKTDTKKSAFSLCRYVAIWTNHSKDFQNSYPVEPIRFFPRPIEFEIILQKGIRETSKMRSKSMIFGTQQITPKYYSVSWKRVV